LSLPQTVLASRRSCHAKASELPAAITQSRHPAKKTASQSTPALPPALSFPTIIDLHQIIVITGIFTPQLRHHVALGWRQDPS
jgi:hypothetical protein